MASAAKPKGFPQVIRQAIPRVSNARLATIHTAPAWMAGGQNEDFPASNADCCRRSGCLGVGAAGTPEESPNYKMSDHWWECCVDIAKCIGCGNCVRACQTENDVPGWILPHLGRALSQVGLAYERIRGYYSQPVNRARVISPTAARKDSRRPPMRAGSTSSFPSCAITARIHPARRCARWEATLFSPDASYG